MRKGAAVAAVVLVAAFATTLAVRRPQPPSRPNVIVYLVDTLRADHLSVYGYERDTSPFLAELAAESVVFDDAYAAASWTRPSVASLFTGLVPARHGAMDRSHSLRRDVPTLAETLQSAGYHTAAFVTNPNVLPTFGFDRGFDHMGDVEAVSRASRAADVHAAVLEYLGPAPRTPLFLYVHTRDPHSPYDVEPPFRKRFFPEDRTELSEAERDVALYDAEIAYADHELRAFVAELRRRGLFEDSVFVFVADHGEEFLEHGDTSHGKTLYEEQLKVPLIVRLPRGAGGGARVPRPVRLIDLMPTLLAYLGLPAVPDVDGESFLPLLRRGDDPEYRPELYAELNHDGNVLTSLIDGRHKLIRRRLPADRAGDELFDLGVDPGEQHNLVGQQPAFATALSKRLDAIEAGFTGGLHVEIRNSTPLTADHVVSGRLVGLDAPPGAAHVLASPVGGADVTVEGNAVRFSARLQNRKNPIRRPPKILVDMLRLRFDGAGGRYRLDVDLDGRALPAQRFVLGREAVADQAPVVVAAEDPRLLVAPHELEGLRRPQDYAFCRVYYVPGTPTQSVVIDEELERRLRALGYLGGGGDR